MINLDRNTFEILEIKKKMLVERHPCKNKKTKNAFSNSPKEKTRLKKKHDITAQHV